MISKNVYMALWCVTAVSAAPYGRLDSSAAFAELENEKENERKLLAKIAQMPMNPQALLALEYTSHETTLPDGTTRISWIARPQENLSGDHPTVEKVQKELEATVAKVQKELDSLASEAIRKRNEALQEYENAYIQKLKAYRQQLTDDHKFSDLQSKPFRTASGGCITITSNWVTPDELASLDQFSCIHGQPAEPEAVKNATAAYILCDLL